MCTETHVCVVHVYACMCGGKGQPWVSFIWSHPHLIYIHYLLKIIHNNYVLLCAHMHDMCEHAHVMVLTWRSEDKWEWLIVSFHHVNPADYLLSFFTGPASSFLSLRQGLHWPETLQGGWAGWPESCLSAFTALGEQACATAEAWSGVESGVQTQVICLQSKNETCRFLSEISVSNRGSKYLVCISTPDSGWPGQLKIISHSFRDYEDSFCVGPKDLNSVSHVFIASVLPSGPSRQSL